MTIGDDVAVARDQAKQTVGTDGVTSEIGWQRSRSAVEGLDRRRRPGGEVMAGQALTTTTTLKCPHGGPCLRDQRTCAPKPTPTYSP